MKSFIVKDAKSDAAKMRSRATNAITSNQIFQTVQYIVDDVAKRGDHAVTDYTKKLDGAQLKSLMVSKKEIDDAYTKVSNPQIKSIRLIRDRLAKSETILLKHFFRKIKTFSDGITINRFTVPL